MEPRMDYNKFAPPGALQAMYGLEKYIAQSGLERPLVHLVKYRVSQINGCAYCLDMHSKDARAEGETEQRLFTLNAWRETPFFTDRERAALGWTESLTLIAQTHAPDEVYEELRKYFKEPEIISLTIVITTINAWNRIAIGFRAVPGIYQPAKHHTPSS